VQGFLRAEKGAFLRFKTRQSGLDVRKRSEKKRMNFFTRIGTKFKKSPPFYTVWGAFFKD
jgi:hypothetical protein